MAELQGLCDSRFERVREALTQGIDSGEEVGVSLCVSVEGENVIDLWGGWRDKEHSAEWTEDTIAAIFSASKTVTSLAVLMLVDRGQIDLHAPVAKYWPEFAQNGKDKVLVRHLLSHTAGLPAWEPPFSMAEAMDVQASTARLAAQAPWWEPGTRGSYHASSFGHLNGELVRRVTGITLSQFIARDHLSSQCLLLPWTYRPGYACKGRNHLPCTRKAGWQAVRYTDFVCRWPDR